jgi:hypothetical protein
MRSNRSGTEPTTARSALGLRAILSGIVLPIALALTVLFIYEAATTRAGIWLAEAVVAAS